MYLIARIPLVLGLLLSGTLCAADYLTVAAQQGDGIYSLLRRYRLVDYGCNIEEFRRINGLQQSSNLFAGREYRLPVAVVEYNGSSIRSTTNNNNWDRAIAIRDYNEWLLQAELRSMHYRRDRRLYVPFHIDNCSPYAAGGDGAARALPPEEQAGLQEVVSDQGSAQLVAVAEAAEAEAPRSYAIFGERYAEVPLIDRSLEGKIFYIVSGHGGPDPGAVGRRGRHVLAEDEYAYDVALRLCRNIIARGGTPYMIVRDEDDGIRDDEFLKPDKDETVWGGASLPRNQKLRLTQRSDIINRLYEENLEKGIDDQTMVVIHVDSRQSGQRIDVFLYHREGDDVGEDKAERIQGTLKAKYDQYQPGRGYTGSVSARDLHMLRESLPTGVYIELANIANSSDQRRIINPRNRQLLADWLLLGLL